MSLATLEHSGPATSTGPPTVTTLAPSGPATSKGPPTVTTLAPSGPATSTGPPTLLLTTTDLGTLKGTRWRSWLRHRATSRMVAG
jgi:hypothetical protein